MQNKIKLRVDPNGLYFLCLETLNYRIPFHYESKRREGMIQIANDLKDDLNAIFEDDTKETHWK